MTQELSYDQIIKEIKHEFMVYRNGIVADTLRKGGINHKIIFGLQLPGITQIARNLGQRFSSEQLQVLARSLWEDKNVRESRLLACRLYPADLLTKDEATQMCKDVITSEEADILTFALLRHTPWLETIYKELSEAATDGKKYSANTTEEDIASSEKSFILKSLRRFLP